MRILTGLGLALVLAGGLSAQRRGGAAFEGFGNVVFPGTGHPPVTRFQSGFGNVVFPGTGRGPVSTPFNFTDPTFASRLGGTVTGLNPGFNRHGFHQRQQPYVYVPYAYPVFADGYYGYGGYGAAPYEQQPNVTVVYPPATAPNVTIINQPPSAEAARPSIQDYGQGTAAPELSNSMERPALGTAPASDYGNDNYYLIAFKDHTIYSAVAYWVDGETLHYFTKGNVHNQASLSLVDRPLTERLNRERDVTVRLPQ